MQTILVIDDDENLRDTIGVLLEREGFRAILAPDGKSGLDQALLGKPALILADLRLPDMSGMEICKRLRASGMPDANYRAERGGRRDRQSTAARNRRGRLRGEAVRNARTAGPRARGAAAHAGRDRNACSRSANRRWIWSGAW